MAKSGFSGKNILINLIVTIVAGVFFFLEEKPYCSARKAKTARPGPKAFSVRKKTVGKYPSPVKI